MSDTSNIQMMAAQNLEEIEDSDTDALFKLPLSIIPLETKALGTARMIKNAGLRGVVELFHDDHAGSGQIEVDNIPEHFGWDPIKEHPDMMILKKLARMPTYDVYSLRVLLRDNGIKVNNYDALKLTKSKSDQLKGYMGQFTRPLIRQIYGTEQKDINDLGDIIALFQDPDIEVAKKQLNLMAEKLQIKLSDIPKFLEDYGDIFLSLAYFKNCLDRLDPLMEDLQKSLIEIKGSFQARTNPMLPKICDQVRDDLNELIAGVAGRFENFDNNTKDLWENLSAERFNKVQRIISDYHTNVGGVLCGLTVCLNAWARKFPVPGAGGPARRADYVSGELKNSIKRIARFTDSGKVVSV